MINKSVIPQKNINEAIRWVCTLSSKTACEQDQKQFFQWLQDSELNQAAYIQAEGLWERGEVLNHVKELNSAREQNLFSFLSVLSPTQSTFAMATYSFCIVICLSLVFYTNFLPGQTQQFAYNTGIGEFLDVQLDDGSQISVNSQSKVEITYSKSERIAHLQQGEVYFEVATEVNRPFLVKTKNGSVSVLGTRFSVRQTDSDTLVTVSEGRVSLFDKPDKFDHTKSGRVLTKNQRSDFTGTITGRQIENIDAEALLSWRRQRLTFRNMPLRQVVSDLNPYFKQEFVFDTELKRNQSVLDKQITGNIKINNIDSVLLTLETFGLIATESEEDDTITFSKSGE